MPPPVADITRCRSALAAGRLSVAMKSGNRRLNVWCGPAHASASAFYAIYNMPRQAVSSWPLLQLINSRAQLTSSRDSYADGRGEPNEGHDPQAALTGTKKATAD